MVGKYVPTSTYDEIFCLEAGLALCLQVEERRCSFGGCEMERVASS